MWQLLQQYHTEWLHFWNWALANSDPRTKDWFLIQSPWPTIYLTTLYLFMVYYGMKLMEHRQPMVTSKSLLFVYNAALVALNLYIFLEVLPMPDSSTQLLHTQVLERMHPKTTPQDELLVICITKAGYSMTCQQCVYTNDENELRVAKALWWFYFSKLVEFSDTFFFILRKKNSQVSFLHVYHHATMFPIWWIGIRWVAGGQSYFGATMNSFIHVVMYTYYGLSALGPHMQKYLWWKKYLTKLQLVQFILGIIHSAQSLYFQCPFPRWMQWSLVFYAFTIFCLFLNFYVQAYIKPKFKTINKNHANGVSDGHRENIRTANGQTTRNNHVKSE